MVHRRDGGWRRRRAGKTQADFSGAEALVRRGTLLRLPFINAVAEHDKDAKQFRNIALRHKKVVLAHIEKLAAEMGAAEPQVLAHQLALLIDGAIVAAMVSRDPGVADTAGLAAGICSDLQR